MGCDEWEVIDFDGYSRRTEARLLEVAMITTFSERTEDAEAPKVENGPT
jgi:hypothetical protein